MSDSDSFVFKPNSIYVPFGADPDSLLVGLHKPLRRRDIAFHHGTAPRSIPTRRQVTLADSTELGYD